MSRRSDQAGGRPEAMKTHRRRRLNRQQSHSQTDPRPSGVPKPANRSGDESGESWRCLSFKYG